jgi:ubiquinone biosynthesis protein
VSKLGVVFVKVAQTLATREDLVGAEAAAALSVLQDANKPFDDRG